MNHTLLRMGFYTAAGTILASITWSTIEHSAVTGDYILSVILLGMMFFIIGQFFVDRWRPEYSDGDFHPTKLWKMPRETTRSGLWLRVGFRTLAGVAIFSALAALLVLLTTARPAFMVLLGALFVLRIPHLYWSMRSRYEEARDDDGVELRYRGGSALNRRTIWLTPALMAGVGAVLATFGALLS
ncbi:MAG: hypothetical protein OXC95_06920 [Dehalococcoidia bacterium]|nr:hypothetical protein [Dehalococcoidia bacterium]